MALAACVRNLEDGRCVVSDDPGFDLTRAGRARIPPAIQRDLQLHPPPAPGPSTGIPIGTPS